ncbi:5'(3')-deoxyribonucleotidase [Sphingobacterium nematocida]|uniref:5'(3')-deoxyribonucleotidase n=1 Tax=Sphingobacterium nematocida TaxID=1513896 RepID=A0A1T5BY01_9SPHI|nr:5'(3')-deoxyribonucleotidase [Sphingobacterium nematocida]SKB52036.1 5'(3')-deoxyribonucleotidase [Sphingobacterium nematocida]
MQNRKSIALDMDGVLADNLVHYLNYYHRETGVQLTEADVLGLPEGECVPDKTAVMRYIESEGFFRTLPVSKDAQEVVKELHSRYDVFVVSAAMEFPWSLREKRDWLDEYFPFISWHNIVFCGYKHIINTDYLIDDHVKNLLTFQGKGLMFNTFHNINEQRFERVQDWKDVYRYFMEK